jgi:3-methylcrotonyl-CoA carboxylase beta subunit
MYPITVRKQLRAQEIARQNRLPCYYIVDSAGAFLPLQADIFPDKEHGGRAFYNEAIMSSRGVSNIAVVCGSCTAGAAYVPCMADEAIIVRGIGSIFLGGPPLVRAATGEIVSVEELGGADVHCGISGVTDHYAEDEVEALEMARDAVLSLNSDLCSWTAHPTPSDLGKQIDAPLHDDVDDFDSLVPPTGENMAGEFPMRRILARILDGSRLVEFKAKFGLSIVAGYAQIHGHPVGVIANHDPRMCAAGARKAAHFVELCSQRRVPIVFFQNVSGFDSSGGSEKDALKESALLMRAVACASVPKLTVVCGESIGAANFAMCGRSQSPRFLYMWPNAKIAMAGELADGDVITMQEGASEEEGEAAQEEWSTVVRTSNAMASQMSAVYSSARCWDDGVVMPKDTREVLRLSLEAVLHRGGPTDVPESARHEGTHHGHHANFGVFRLKKQTKLCKSKGAF